MNNFTSTLDRNTKAQRCRSSRLLILLTLCVTCSTGCSILRPVRGVPAAYLPNEFEGARRSGKRTINPSLLVQTPPDQHRVAAGDVLSIYIPGVLGRVNTELREFGVEPPINQPFSPADPPTIGYPITVRDDQTIALPQIPPIYVHNKTLHETELAIRKAYTEDFRILRPEEAMILVSLQRPRVHRVLVVRQETGNELASGGEAGSINIGVSKRGTARVVTLNAYENDVLHALAMEDGVDGLPGLDAENTIYIIRRRNRKAPQEATAARGFVAPQPSQFPQRKRQHHQAQHTGLGTDSRNSYGAPFGKPAQGIQQTGWSTDGSPDSIIDAAYRSAGLPPAGLTGVHPAGHKFASVQVPPLPVPPSSGEMQPLPPADSDPVYQNNVAPHLAPAPQGSGYFYPQQIAPAQQYPGHQFSAPVSPAYPSPNSMQLHVQQPPPLPGIYDALPEGGEQWSGMLQNFDPTIDNPNVIRIPIRLAPGEQLNINEEMITLQDGDIVFIESRETDVFYTGGLLGGGQYTLPREYDLGVLEAISIAEGRTAGQGGNSRAIGGVSALNRDVSVSASRVIILRTLATGQRITIEVDLHKAMRYQEENILVQPGDLVMLQYTAGEAIVAYTQRYLLEGALFGLAAAQLTGGQ